jgi:hypothetical protein
MKPQEEVIASDEIEYDKPSIIEKIVDSIHKDIIDVLETVKETENS